MAYHTERGDILTRKLSTKINAARRDHGRQPLTHVDELNQTAADYAETLRYSDTRDHYQDGSPADRASAYMEVRENIYWAETSGFDAGRFATRAIQSWLQSDGHRRNLLEPSMRVGGLGVATTTGQVYVVHMLSEGKTATAALRDRVVALNPL